MAGEATPGRRSGDSQEQLALRASHTDRDRVVDLLRIAAGDGRLTAEELEERLEAALTARTYAELAVLTADLPLSGPAGGPPVPAKDLVRIECGGGTARRDGQWRVPRRLQIVVRSGTVHLDLTRAVITHPVLELDALVDMSSLTIVTRPGIVVDTDELSVTNGTVSVREHDATHVPTTLQIQVTGRVHMGSFRARPPRRTLRSLRRRRQPGQD